MNCSGCGKKVKFKDRYVLGKGFPVANGTTQSFLGLGRTPFNGAEEVKLKYFPELRLEGLPKYRLVLERIK